MILQKFFVTLHINFDLQSELKSKTYPLVVDEYEPDTYKVLEHRIKQRFASGGNKLVNINLVNRYEVRIFFYLRRYYNVFMQTLTWSATFYEHKIELD